MSNFPCESHVILLITQYGELGSSSLTHMKDDYTVSSHYLSYTFLLRKVGRMYFLNLGVKGLTHTNTHSHQLNLFY